MGLPLRRFGRAVLDFGDFRQIGLLGRANSHARGHQIPKQRTVTYTDMRPTVILLRVDAAGLAIRRRRHGRRAMSESHARNPPAVRDPDVKACSRPSRRNHRKSRPPRDPSPCFQHFQICAGGNQGGNNDEIGFDIERTDIGDEFEQLDAGDRRGWTLARMFSPVKQRVGTGHHR